MRKGQPTTVTYPRWQHMGPEQLMLLMASRLGLGGNRVAYGVCRQEAMVRKATALAKILAALYCIARAHTTAAKEHKASDSNYLTP